MHDRQFPELNVRASITAAVAALTLTSTSAQEIDYQVGHGIDRETFGSSMAPIGDADGDGVTDFVVCADGHRPIQLGGTVHALSGATGSELYQIAGPFEGSFGYSCSSVGDLDGDGVDEFVVGDHEANYAGATSGSAWLFSGLTGNLIQRIDGLAAGEFFGGVIARVGDLNGDSVSDFAISAPGATPSGTARGEVRIYSGATLTVIRTLTGGPTSSSFGHGLAGGLDYDSDGTPDIVVGDSGESELVSRGGSIRVFSGSNGSVLFVRHGQFVIGALGYSIAVLTDTNGDGINDFVVSEVGVSRVELIAGGTGATLMTEQRFQNYIFGFRVINAGDVDGDGRDDIGIGTPYANAGTGYQPRGLGLIIDSQGGELLAFEGADNELLAWELCGLGDIDGDGLAEVVLGGPGFTGGGRDAGRIWVVSADSSIGNSYCVPAANSTGAPADMTASGIPFVSANSLALRCSNMPRFSFGFFMTSRAQDFVAGPGGSQGNLCLGGSIGRFVAPGEIQNSGEAATIELATDLTAFPQPNGFIGVQVGDTWNFQAWYRDASGGVPTSNFSDGLTVDFR